MSNQRFYKSAYAKNLTAGKNIELVPGISWFTIGNADANVSSSYKLYLPDDISTQDHFVTFTDMAFGMTENLPIAAGSDGAIKIECVTGSINVVWRD